jgi:uncharacterized membrane protein
MTTQHAPTWTGTERRAGTERRSTTIAWTPERRSGERRRGGVGTRRPNPLEELFEGMDPTPEQAFTPQEPGRGVLPRAVRPAHRPHDAIPSVAAIAGHPIHPALVPLPIGSFVGALAADVAFAASGDPFFARAARLLTGAGIVTGAVVGAFGAVDFVAAPAVRSHTAAWLHAGGNAAALGIGVASLALRSRKRGPFDDGSRTVLPGGLVLSAAAGAVLAVTGWLGGELAFRHRVGVTERERRD